MPHASTWTGSNGWGSWPQVIVRGMSGGDEPTSGSLSGTSVDFTETGTALLGVVQLLLAAVGFGLLFVVTAAFRLVTLEPAPPESAVLSVLFGAAAGAGLGAGVPSLVQRRERFDRTARSPAAGVVGSVLTFGTYALLFAYDPVSSVIYAITYLIGRGGVSRRDVRRRSGEAPARLTGRAARGEGRGLPAAARHPDGVRRRRTR